jgi:hypothetical protein
LLKLLFEQHGAARDEQQHYDDEIWVANFQPRPHHHNVAVHHFEQHGAPRDEQQDHNVAAHHFEQHGAPRDEQQHYNMMM